MIKIKESWATYTLFNSDNALGVATLIRNDKNINKISSSRRHKHMFRMIGSITYENTFIEIVPVITKEQQANRKKRSIDAEYVPMFDDSVNSHVVREAPVPQIEFAKPLIPGKFLKHLSVLNLFKKIRFFILEIFYIEIPLTLLPTAEIQSPRDENL